MLPCLPKGLGAYSAALASAGLRNQISRHRANEQEWGRKKHPVQHAFLNQVDIDAIVVDAVLIDLPASTIWVSGIRTGIIDRSGYGGCEHQQPEEQQSAREPPHHQSFWSAKREATEFSTTSASSDDAS